MLLPLFTRAKARSDDELRAVLQKALPAVITVSMPVSLALFLGADLWIRMIGGAEFVSRGCGAARIAPAFVLNYLAMLCASSLNLLGRAWAVTRISIAGLFINAILNVVLIPAASHLLGPGGSGVGAASAGVLTELFACGCMIALLRGWALSPSVIRTLLMLALSSAGVLLIDRLLLPLGTGAADCWMPSRSSRSR